VKLALAAGLALWAGVAQARCPPPPVSGTPPVDMEHIFCGEVRRDGRAVGFHSRPGGHNPDTVSGTDEMRPDRVRPGIYALLKFRISSDGRSGIKSLSTMFPDHCDADNVIAAIRHAYRTGQKQDRGFHGESGPDCQDRNGRSFRIEGFTATKGGQVVIVTAYPGR